MKKTVVFAVHLKPPCWKKSRNTVLSTRSLKTNSVNSDVLDDFPPWRCKNIVKTSVFSSKGSKMALDTMFFDVFWCSWSKIFDLEQQQQEQQQQQQKERKRERNRRRKVEKARGETDRREREKEKNREGKKKGKKGRTLQTQTFTARPSLRMPDQTNPLAHMTPYDLGAGGDPAAERRE